MEQYLVKIDELSSFYELVTSYPIDIWINNAVFGRHQSILETSVEEITLMVNLNVETSAILSTLFVKDHKADEHA